MPLAAPARRDRAVDAGGASEALVEVGLGGDGVAEQVVDLRGEALRRERVLRVELAVGEAGRQCDVGEARVTRGAVIGDVVRRHREEGLVLRVGEHRIDLGIGTDIARRLERRADAPVARLDDSVVADLVLLADGADRRHDVGGKPVATEPGVDRLDQPRSRRGEDALGAHRHRQHLRDTGGAADAGVVEAREAAIRVDAVRVAVAAVDAVQVLGVVGKAAVAVHDQVVLLILAVDPDVEIVAVQVAVAVVRVEPLVAAIAALGQAAFGTALEALDRLAGDDVHDAGHRVGAVGRRAAILLHVDGLHDRLRDAVGVDEVALAVVGERVVGGALSVDQHQGGVRRQAAQRYARGAAGEGAVAGEVLRQVARAVGGDRLQRLRHRGDAALLEVDGAQVRHRVGAGQVGVAQDRAGDDDRFRRARRRCCRWAGSLDCRGCGGVVRGRTVGRRRDAARRRAGRRG